MVIISKYRLKFNSQKGFFKVISYEESVCPKCKSSMNCIGSRKRKMIEEDGMVKWLSIRRLKCYICNKIHHELPDILLKGHVYCKDVIEKILAGNIIDSPCPLDTIIYICKKFLGYIPTFHIGLPNL